MRGKLGVFVALAWLAGSLSNCGGSSFASDDGGSAGCVPIVPPNLSITCGNGRCGVLDSELPQ